MLLFTVLLVATAGIATADWVLLARANPEYRLPWVGWPPRHTGAHQGAMVLGLLCSFVAGYRLNDLTGVSVAFFAGPVVLIGSIAVVIVVHNRRLGYRNRLSDPVAPR